MLCRFNYNYGVMGWLDMLHGTYRAPQQQKEKHQQRLLTKVSKSKIQSQRKSTVRANR